MENEHVAAFLFGAKKKIHMSGAAIKTPQSNFVAKNNSSRYYHIQLQHFKKNALFNAIRLQYF